MLPATGRGWNGKFAFQEYRVSLTRSEIDNCNDYNNTVNGISHLKIVKHGKCLWHFTTIKMKDWERKLFWREKESRSLKNTPSVQSGISVTIVTLPQGSSSTPNGGPQKNIFILGNSLWEVLVFWEWDPGQGRMKVLSDASPCCFCQHLFLRATAAFTAPISCHGLYHSPAMHTCPFLQTPTASYRPLGNFCWMEWSSWLWQ